MSTSRGDLAENVTKNRQIFLNELGTEESRLAQGKQVSQDGVLCVTEPGLYEKQDALITDAKNVYLGILTADCSPILLWSSERPLVAAVHSGWQGSELDILGKTISIILSEYAIAPETLYMAIGPGLSRENFEVGPEFVEKFENKYLYPRKNSNTYSFDNNGYLMDRALALGLPENQIEVLPYCSLADDSLFFSHRRDRGVTGRMLSVIGIKK